MTTRNSATEIPDGSYDRNLRKEAEFWGMMAEERWKGGIPLTMDYRLATTYQVRREALGWGDYIQDPKLEPLTPFGREKARFVEFCRKLEGGRVLDLCCGAGWLSLEHARAGKNVDAVDCSEQGIEIAKRYQAQLVEKPAGKINWIVADLNRYDLPPGEYDLVTVWDGLHHIRDIERLCTQIHRSLKPGGYLVFSERVWGGEGRAFRTKLSNALENTLNICLPMTIPYEKRMEIFKDMIEAVYGRISPGDGRRRPDARRQVEPEVWSPFEDSTGTEMFRVIRELFDVRRTDRFGAFTEEACRSLDLPRPLRVPVILFLSWFDYLLTKTRLLEGKILVGYARK